MSRSGNGIRMALWGLALAGSLCTPAFALDKAKISLLNTDNDALRDSLKNASIALPLVGQPDVTPRDVLTAAQADYANMVEALYAQGYYSASVRIELDGQEAAQIDPFHPPGQIKNLRILVEPGQRFVFGKARLGPLAPGASVPEGFAPGQPALATAVRNAAQSAVTDWRAAGYAKANIAAQDISADHGASKLNVGVQIAPGPRLRFGDVTVTGESTVKPGRVRQIAGIPRGDRYHPDDVEKAAARLRRTGTFQSVQIAEADQPGADGNLDLTINVIDRKARRIGGGAEVSTLDGLTLSGFWLHRNLFGGAERLRIDGEITQIGAEGLGIDYALTFRLEKPAVYGPDTQFYTEFELSHEDEPDYTESKVGLTLGASREFNEHLTGDLGLAVSYSEVTDRFADPQTTRELLIYSLPMALTYDRRNDKLDTTSGYYINTEFEPFHDARNGESGTRFTFDGRGYASLGDTGTVLAGRLQLGTLTGPDAVDAPPGFLFYSGGSGTVRGQPYESLGATHDGQDLGGKALAATSAEIRYALTDTIGLVGFADAGFVGADGFKDGDWHAGGGLGLRYKTPVGPIRVDLAGPLAGQTDDGVQVYIGIGQAF